MATIDAFDVVELAQDLMAIESTSGSEADVIAFAEQLLGRRGWRMRRINVTEGRYSLLASAGDRIDVTLSTHLDTVPPYLPPRVEGDVLWGRGACDAKGIASAMIAAAERLRGQGIAAAVLLVVGEETAHDGAHAANELPNTSKVLINGEPTESKLALGTKGALRVELRTTGVPAHSAYPHLGHSAIEDLITLLHELRAVELPNDPVLGSTTMNIGFIGGGVADNVVAPDAWARLMFRTVTAPEDVLAYLRRAVGNRAHVVAGVMAPPVHLGRVAGFETAVMAYTTDIPALSRWGRPYLFGPGSILVAHGDDEHISIPELRASVDTYVKLAEQALADLA